MKNIMWKYGLIKIEYPGLWETDGDYCELVELYSDKDGNYTSFCEANIHSLEELESAYKDAKKDGVNEWFAESGEFTWDKEEKFWSWTKNDK